MHEKPIELILLKEELNQLLAVFLAAQGWLNVE